MKYKRIDIHSHVNFPDFDSDRDEVIVRALDSGTAFISVGTDLKTSRETVELANKYSDGVYAIVGMHPLHTQDAKEEEYDVVAYRNLLRDPKVVGIGECGLDYFRLGQESVSKQRKFFEEQIVLANEFKKPLMLHIRDAYDDAIAILKTQSKVLGNAHFFVGTKEQARGFLDLGYTVSFTGVITFAKQYTELVEYVPLNMIQVETDCPYAAPLPYRGKRNEPSYVIEVIKKIAEIKKLFVDDVEKQLILNAKRVWGIPQ